MTIARVQYTEQQILRAADLNDEQEYRLAAQRRHLIGQHIWGIVQGLRLQAVNGGFVVQTGYAVDGFGRELVLPQPLFTPWAAGEQHLFDAIANASFIASDPVYQGLIDVWLLYMPTPAEPARRGWRVCETVPAPRWRDDVCLSLTAVYRIAGQARPPDVDARRPPYLPPEILARRPHEHLPDEPLPAWPVYLGRLFRQSLQKQYLDGPYVEHGGRPYAGLVGASVVSASCVAVAEDPERPPDKPQPPAPSAQLTARQAGERRRVTATLADDKGALIDALTLDTFSGAAIRGPARLISPPPGSSAGGGRDLAVDLLIAPVGIEFTEADISDPAGLVCGLADLESLFSAPPDPPPPTNGSPPEKAPGASLSGRRLASSPSPPSFDMSNIDLKELASWLNDWLVDPRSLDQQRLANLPLRQVTRELLSAPDARQQRVLARRALLEDLFPEQLATPALLPTVHGVEFRSPPKPAKVPAPWRVYSVEIERDGKKVRQLRIEIGTTGDKAHPERSQFMIGSWSAERKDFLPCLAIDEACTVEMAGDLTVVGDIIQNPTPSQPGNLGVLEQLAEEWQQGIAEGLAEQANLTVEIRSPNTAQAGSAWPYDVYVKNEGTSPMSFISVLENVWVGGNFATRTAATIPSLPAGAEATRQITHSDPNLPALNLAAGNVTVMITVLGFGPTFNAIYVSKGKTMMIVP